MKQILIILGLFASVSTFAQSPRIKLNQITKDTVKGSVLISSPSDSGMVYSRDFYIAYGADTVLILYGDTLGGVGGGFASVLSDGVTITGDGTTGNELKVDTSLIATLTALTDSLATVPTKTTPDSVTITGDGSVANPLKVDTFLISTIQGLVDTLSARGYLTANETITLSGDVTGSGTTSITATVVDDSHNHIISNVDFLQDSLNAKANDSDLANYVTIAGTETITGAKTFTNTFTQSGGDANFDNNTLYVDESANNVGIGTNSPTARLEVSPEQNVTGSEDILMSGLARNIHLTMNGLAIRRAVIDFQSAGVSQWTMGRGDSDELEADKFFIGTGRSGGNNAKLVINQSGNVGIGTSSPSYKVTADGSGNAFMYAALSDSIGYVGNWVGYLYGYTGNSHQKGATIFESIDGNGRGKFHIALNNVANSSIVTISDAKLTVLPSGEVGIGETNPSEKLDVNGNGLFTGNLTVNGTTLTANNYEFDIDQTVGASEDNYVLTYDNADGQISLEPISLSGSATLDFGSTSSLNSSDLTITVTGAADGDVVSLGVPNASVNANTNYTAWVSAANTVTVRFNNYSLGAVDPASGTFKVKVFK